MKHANVLVLSASDATSQTSSKIDSVELFAGSFHAYFGDATAAGSVKIQASNDICTTQYLPATFTPTHWVDIPSATASVTTGGSVFIPLPNIQARWLRVVWTQTTPGTTTINVNMFALSY